MTRGWISKIIWYCIYVLAACSFCTFLLINLPSPVYRKFAETDQPFLYEKKHLYFGDLSDFAVCENTLLVLYDSKQALQCYDLEGNLLFSYSLRMSPSGRAVLYTDGTKYFLEDHDHNYYVFSSDGRYIEYVTEENSKSNMQQSFLTKKASRTTVEGDYYQLKGASIYRAQMGKQAKEILHRPFWMVLFQGANLLVFTMILTGISVARYFYLQKQ